MKTYEIFVKVPSVLVIVQAEDETAARALALSAASDSLFQSIKHWPEDDDIESVEECENDNPDVVPEDGTSGQDRKAYNDTQDRENYTVEEEDEGD